MGRDACPGAGPREGRTGCGRRSHRRRDPRQPLPRRGRAVQFCRRGHDRHRTRQLHLFEAGKGPLHAPFLQGRQVDGASDGWAPRKQFAVSRRRRTSGQSDPQPDDCVTAMSPSLLLQSVLSGLTNGFVYGLIGLGLASIFRGTRIINAMQGDFALIGGITAALLLERFGWPMAPAFAAAVVVGGIAGWLMEVLLIRPLRRRGGSERSYLFVTPGVALPGCPPGLYAVGPRS